MLTILERKERACTEHIRKRLLNARDYGNGRTETAHRIRAAERATRPWRLSWDSVFFANCASNTHVFTGTETVTENLKRSDYAWSNSGTKSKFGQRLEVVGHRRGMSNRPEVRYRARSNVLRDHYGD